MLERVGHIMVVLGTMTLVVGVVLQMRSTAATRNAIDVSLEVDRLRAELDAADQARAAHVQPLLDDQMASLASAHQCVATHDDRSTVSFAASGLFLVAGFALLISARRNTAS